MVLQFSYKDSQFKGTALLKKEKENPAYEQNNKTSSKKQICFYNYTEDITVKIYKALWH